MNKDSTHLRYFARGNATSSDGLAMNLVLRASHGYSLSNFIFLKYWKYWIKTTPGTAQAVSKSKPYLRENWLGLLLAAFLAGGRLKMEA